MKGTLLNTGKNLGMIIDSNIRNLVGLVLFLFLGSMIVFHAAAILVSAAAILSLVVEVIIVTERDFEWREVTLNILKENGSALRFCVSLIALFYSMTY